MKRRLFVALVAALMSITLVATAATSWGPWRDGSNSIKTCVSSQHLVIQMWGGLGTIYQMEFNDHTGASHTYTSQTYTYVGDRNLEVHTPYHSGRDPDARAGFAGGGNPPPAPDSVNLTCKND